MTSGDRRSLRRYGAQFEAMVLVQCDEPGASVAQVAMSHGILDNVVHRWRQLSREGRLVSSRPSEAVALTMMSEADAAPPHSKVTVELRRGAFTMNVSWLTNV